ncbi:MAG: DUF3047 domain-containing protein [Deltaproteobacteria bacterium]|nr:DUF3047 domain-containing protein [Deltaproteobacteria bacterium]
MKFFVLFLIFPLFIVRAEEILIDDFSSYKVDQFPADEESGIRWGIVSSNPFETDQYHVRKEGDNQYLEGVADFKREATYGKAPEDVKVTRIVKAHRFEFKDGTPFLRWKWRVHEFPAGSQEDVQYLNDSAAAVLVTFMTPSRAYPTIQYIWSRSVPAGEVFPNPAFNEDFPTYFKIMRSGSAEDSQLWVEEEVNVFEDFKKIFGEKYADYLPVIGISVLTDANNTQSRAHGEYDDFYRSSRAKY